MTKARFIILASLFIASCSKDETTTTPVVQPPATQDSLTCKPIKISLTTDFDLSDTSPYAYGLSYNNTLIQSLNRNTGNVSYQYAYNSSLPVKRDKLVNSIVSSTDSIIFTASELNAVRHYEASKLYDEWKFTYSSGMIIKKELIHYGATTTSSYNSYNYISGLLNKVDRHSSSGSLYDSYTYAYGTQANKLYKQNKLISLYLHLDEDMESIIYDGLLSNDVLMTGITYTEVGKSPVSYNITYDFNAEGYPVSVKADGKTIITIEYDCSK